MKWLGQYIQDLTARFRDDVYLENISSGTIASGGNLGLDSNNKIVKQSDTGITDLHGAGVDGANNQVLTDDGDGTVTSESNLTFDGTTLTTTGKSAISAGSTVGGPALTVTQADVDQDAVSIDATALTAGGVKNPLFIDTQNSVTGVHVDQDVTLVSNFSNLGGFYSNVSKSGHTSSGQTTSLYGAHFVTTDTGTNVGTANVTGLQLQSNISNANGTTNIVGVNNIMTGSADSMIGFLSQIPSTATDIMMYAEESAGADYFSLNIGEGNACSINTVHDGGNEADLTFNIDGDISFKNFAGRYLFYVSGNDGDYFSIDVGSNGDTVLGTVDAAADSANLSLLADGIIGHYSNGSHQWIKTGNNSDYLQLDIGTHGDAKFWTVDAAAAAAHFEIEADGDITLDAAGDIKLEAAGNDISLDSDTFTINSSTGDYPQVKLLNTTNDDQASQLIFDKLRADDGVATGQNLGEIHFNGQDSAQNTQTYSYIISEIDVSTSGQESGKLNLGVASHNGTNQPGIVLTGGSVSGEVDVGIGRGAASLTTVEGNLTSLGTITGENIVTAGDLTLDNVVMSNVQTSAETFADNDTSIMTSAAIDDKINTKHTYVYLHVHGRSSTGNDNWHFQDASNDGEFNWETDGGADAFADDTYTDVGNSTVSLGREVGVMGMVIPYDCTLIGFKAIGRDLSGDDEFKAGLWSSPVFSGYGGSTGTTTFTLRAVATASTSGGSGGSFNGICKLDDLTRSYSLSAGQILCPSIAETDTNRTYVSMTIVLKVPIIA